MNRLSKFQFTKFIPENYLCTLDSNQLIRYNYCKQFSHNFFLMRRKHIHISIAFFVNRFTNLVKEVILCPKKL